MGKEFCMRKSFVALSIFVVILAGSCKDLTFNGDMKGYLEFYTTTAILSKHGVRTESYFDASGNLSVPSHNDAVIDLYTTNPKQFTLEPTFVAQLTSQVSLTKDLAAYNITIKQNPNDKAHYEARIPQDLLLELDQQNSGLTLTITPVEEVSQRPMPEYSLSLRSNSKPVFGSPKAVVMQTKDEVNGEKKWVLGFELPDLTGIHKDLVALQINGTSYAVDGTKGQGAAALTSMGSSLTAIDKVAVKDGGGAFFQPSVSDRGIYFVTDDKIGTSQTYTIKLIDKAGLEATLPPVSTTDTTYGKEIVSFAFESSKNSSQSLGQDLTGSINGTSITIPVPASLATMNRTALTPTISLSGGEVAPRAESSRISASLSPTLSPQPTAQRTPTPSPWT